MSELGYLEVLHRETGLALLSTAPVVRMAYCDGRDARVVPGADAVGATCVA